MARNFGIEFEFSGSWESVKKYFSRAIRKVYGPRRYISRDDSFDSDFALDKWHIKKDGSGSPEVTTPVSCLKDLKLIKRVLRYVSDYGLTADEDNGLHVHLDVKDIDKYHVLGSWLRCEKSVTEMFPDFRKNSYHCDKLIDRQNNNKIIATVIEKMMDESECHTSMLSCEKYDKRKTIEFRISESNVDPDFVEAWIKFLIKFANHTKEINPTVIGKYKTNHLKWFDMIEEFGLDKRTTNILMARHTEYA